MAENKKVDVYRTTGELHLVYIITVNGDVQLTPEEAIELAEKLKNACAPLNTGDCFFCDGKGGAGGYTCPSCQGTGKRQQGLTPREPDKK